LPVVFVVAEGVTNFAEKPYPILLALGIGAISFFSLADHFI
jgi:hypothetical protein